MSAQFCRSRFHTRNTQKVLKNKRNFNDFCGLGGRSWHQQSIKNRSKTEAQDEWPLGIDFWWILVGFGRQVGVESRAKSDQKSIKKRIEKIMKKRCVLKALGWGCVLDGLRRGGDPGTP